MKYQLEPLADILHELRPLLTMHYDEIAKHKDTFKLDPDWTLYSSAEHAGLFKMFTARTDEGKLVGYNAYFINPHPHYKNVRCALNDLFYIIPKHRGKMTGIRLLAFSEKILTKDNNVKAFFMHMKPEHDFAKLLVRKGYNLHEHTYAKVLD